MGNPVILAIDCGSQSVKALIFDTKGNGLAKEQKAFEKYDRPKPNWAERDADAFFNRICDVTNALKKSYPDLFAQIQGVSLTTQRDTVVFLDKKKRSFRPVILWMDKRKQKEHKPMPFIYNVLTKLVGMYRTAVAVNKQCPAHWVQKHQPEVWENTDKYVYLSGYLNYLMTGILKDSTANQIGHMPFNYKTSEWESKYAIKAQFFQIPKEKLIELTPAAQVFGAITKAAAKATGIPEGTAFISAGSDKGCETLGTGCLDESKGAISLGSQASVQVTSKRYFETVPFVPPFPAVVPGMYNPEIQIYKGFWMISWFKEEFNRKDVEEAAKAGEVPEDRLNAHLKEIPPGCNGLLLQPYWGSPIDMPEAKGAMVGFSDVHTRYHIYRAIIEGIGFALKDGIRLIEKKSKVEISQLMLSGGGSLSEEICQISADIFGKPVSKVQTNETSGLGAAMVGFVALGTIDSFEQAVDQMVHVKETYLPDRTANGKYEQIFKRIYLRMYGQLKPIYDEMFEIEEH
ncbi:MAG: FGGY-family carbohydrate kinase [Eubacteriales bacterium]